MKNFIAVGILLYMIFSLPDKLFSQSDNATGEFGILTGGFTTSLPTRIT